MAEIVGPKADEFLQKAERAFAGPPWHINRSLTVSVSFYNNCCYYYLFIKPKGSEKCKHKTHTKYNTSIGQNKHILDMNSLR